MADVEVMITLEETKLVSGIAMKVYRKHCPAGQSGQMTREDLKHYGIVGLIEAKKNFDPTKGVPWLKFAAYRIYGAMMDAVRKLPIIRLPQEKYRKVKSLKSARLKLEKRGQNPDTGSIAEELGWTLDEVIAVERLSPTLISMENDRQGEEEIENRTGIVLGDSNSNPEKLHLQEELADIVQKCLKTLTPPNIRFTFVARAMEGLKLKDIAKTFGKSIETVRQWHEKAKQKMKACLKSHGWT